MFGEIRAKILRPSENLTAPTRMWQRVSGLHRELFHLQKIITENLYINLQTVYFNRAKVQLLLSSINKSFELFFNFFTR